MTKSVWVGDTVSGMTIKRSQLPAVPGTVMHLKYLCRMEYIVRFIAGGLVVSLFAVLGDVLRPKSFAGLFGAAPSVALTTLGLAYWKHGGDYVSLEARAMQIGALSLGFYSFVVVQLLMRRQWSAASATGVALSVWLALALGLKQMLLE